MPVSARLSTHYQEIPPKKNCAFKSAGISNSDFSIKLIQLLVSSHRYGLNAEITTHDDMPEGVKEANQQNLLFHIHSVMAQVSTVPQNQIDYCYVPHCIIFGAKGVCCTAVSDVPPALRNRDLYSLRLSEGSATAGSACCYLPHSSRCCLVPPCILILF